MMTNKKYKVKLDNVEKIEQLLQETYDQACQQHNSIQNEMNKIMNTTVVNDLDIDGKEKYGKIMKEYFTLQQKAVGIKMDIAKLMTEIVKSKGNVKEALESDSLKNSKLDFVALRKLAKEASTPANESENYNIKK